jgi:hypothetical protein
VKTPELEAREKKLKKAILDLTRGLFAVSEVLDCASFDDGFVDDVIKKLSGHFSEFLSDRMEDIH